jgi:NADPH:quinone reductase-like Zn-dependent oxidoreductase
MTTLQPQSVRQNTGAGMLAVVCTRYGTPDALQVQHVAKPVPKEGDVLIKVHAACVTPSDVAFRTGDPFIVRLLYGLARPRLAALGVQLAKAFGAAVTGVCSTANLDRVTSLGADEVIDYTKVDFTTAGPLQSRSNLNYLKELFDAGKLRAVIDRRYSLAQIAEAHTYVEGDHKRGTVVITVGDASAR